MKYFLIIFLQLIFQQSKSQITVYNKNLIDSSINQMYLGIENKIVVTSINTTNLVLKANNSRFEKYEEDNVFFSRPFKPGMDTLKIYSKSKLVYSWLYRVDTVPYPVARVAGLLDTVLSVYEILRQPTLVIIYPFTNLKANVRVARFTSIISGSDGTYEEISNSYYLTARQKDLIKRLKSGDTIYFDGIYTSCPTGRTQKMKPFTVYIR